MSIVANQKTYDRIDACFKKARTISSLWFVIISIFIFCALVMCLVLFLQKSTTWGIFVGLWWGCSTFFPGAALFYYKIVNIIVLQRAKECLQESDDINLKPFLAKITKMRRCLILDLLFWFFPIGKIFTNIAFYIYYLDFKKKVKLLKVKE